MLLLLPSQFLAYSRKGLLFNKVRWKKNASELCSGSQVRRDLALSLALLNIQLPTIGVCKRHKVC
jgi:hypothetical protein